MTKLHIISGPDKGQSFDLKNGIICIGRSPDNDIQIEDESVSRNHLKIRREGNKYFIEDLESANGTYIDGKQISPNTEFEVKEGLPISVGMITICLGKDASEDILAALDSIDLSKELSQDDILHTQDRPMTPEKNMELISKVSNILMQSLNIDEILEKILDCIFDLLKRIERGVVIIIDKETGEISEVIRRSEKAGDDTGAMYSRSVVDRVIREGKPLIILDSYSEDEIDFSESLKLMKIKSVMCVPLISRSQIRGVLYVDSINEQFGFRHNDIVLFKALGSPAALAIENALLSSNSR